MLLSRSLYRRPRGGSTRIVGRRKESSHAVRQLENHRILANAPTPRLVGSFARTRRTAVSQTTALRGWEGEGSSHGVTGLLYGAAVTFTRMKRFGVVPSRKLSRTFSVVALLVITVVVAALKDSGCPSSSVAALCTS